MKIMEGFVLKTLEARNGIFLAPMDTQFSEEGYVNDFHIQHYGSRSYGGVGLVLVEGTAITKEGRYREKSLGIWKDEHIQGLSRLVNIIKKGGALAGIQLFHGGSKSQLQEEIKGISTYFDFLDQSNLKILNYQEFMQLAEEFVLAAHRAKKAGFDFIEITAGDGILLSTLFNKQLNTIIDEDSILARLQPLVYILQKIKTDVDIPIGIRLSVNDTNPEGIKITDYEKIMPIINEFLDYVHVSGGDILSKRKSTIGGEHTIKLHRLIYAEKLVEYTNLPVVVAGNFVSREDIELAESKKIKGVAIGRALLANPNLVLTKLLSPSEINSEYHWNNNPWYNHSDFIK